jgi:anti-anti-sigma regulatory factor
MSKSIIKTQGRRLNAKHGAELQAAVTEAWGSGVECVAIDCSELEAADSLGLGALVRIMRMKPKDRRIVLRDVNSTIMAAIRLVHLTQIFEFESRENEQREADDRALQVATSK